LLEALAVGVQPGDVLTVTDDPHIPRAMGSRPFDGEGIASKPMPILGGGALQNVYVDTYYGRKLGLPPTTGGSSNLVVGLGKGDLASLCKDVGTGVYVTSWGATPTARPASSRWAYGATSSKAVRSASRWAR